MDGQHHMSLCTWFHRWRMQCQVHAGCICLVGTRFLLIKAGGCVCPWTFKSICTAVFWYYFYPPPLVYITLYFPFVSPFVSLGSTCTSCILSSALHAVQLTITEVQQRCHAASTAYSNAGGARLLCHKRSHTRFLWAHAPAELMLVVQQLHRGFVEIASCCYVLMVFIRVYHLLTCSPSWR